MTVMSCRLSTCAAFIYGLCGIGQSTEGTSSAEALGRSLEKVEAEEGVAGIAQHPPLEEVDARGTRSFFLQGITKLPNPPQPAQEEDARQRSLPEAATAQVQLLEGREAEQPADREAEADGTRRLTEKPTCRKYKCGPYRRRLSCQCNDKCKRYRDCCYDYDALCSLATRPTSEPTPLPTRGVMKCESETNYGEVVMPEAKGLALDDTTFEKCADEIPTHWPNTNQMILSMRLFKPWGMTAPKIFTGDMHKAWRGLKSWAASTGAKILIGISVTCEMLNDEKEWAAGKRFINYIGADRIMGVAIGNEIDLQIGAANAQCIDDLWKKGGYEKLIKRRVKEFEKIPGMRGKPITAVVSMQSMSSYPFIWKVRKFLRNIWKTWGDRFVMSVNVYPQFNSGLRKGGCHGAATSGTSYNTSDPDNLGFMPNLVKDIRKRMAEVGGQDRKLWIGETGWATHAYCVLGCYEACNAPETQEKFYNGFLKWDLLDGLGGPKNCGKPTGKCREAVDFAMTDGIYGHPEWYPGLTNSSPEEDFQDHLASQDRGGCPHTCKWEAAHPSEKPTVPVTPQGAEHVFYFTLRDSYVFGQREEFGILKECGDPKCKF
eukprot:TRINITY_DN14_c0_g1_i3.p1 TRINITY_DN14_c0_g1~~TRINITY_DN14_c0_g1_i3.p1  ORF type:complete len:601 (-),score=99.29 TRINITY_DN14_c0_g1_i3:142-1944(-)